MDQVTDLELGLTEELMIGLAGQELGDLTELRIALAQKSLIDLLSTLSLLGREMIE